MKKIKKINPNSSLKEVNHFIKEEIKMLIEGHRIEHDVFYQAVEEVLLSIAPLYLSDEKYFKNAIVKRLAVPDRIIKFKVEWLDDNNEIQVNTGYRVQFNNSLGPYKGGLRFHPSVNEGILKFLGFEQILKNALTGLPIGGGKGGIICDPRKLSVGELERLSRAYIRQVGRIIGLEKDSPAPDVYTTPQIMAWMMDEYQVLVGHHEPGVITGNAQFVKKVVFPLEILPLVVLGTALFHFIVSVIILLAFILISGSGLPVTALWLPVVVAPLVMLTAGISWFLASLSVYLRDIGQLMGIVSTVLLFLSPMFYPITSVPEQWRAWMYLNPITAIIIEVREVAIWGNNPNWTVLGIYSLVAITVMVLGYLWFMSTRKGFADVL